MRTATGLIPGPLSPPVRLAMRNVLVSMSIAMPGIVLIRDIISLPASTTQRAKSPIRVTFGLSFVMSGKLVAARTADTTLAACPRSVPKAMPPSLIFGHEMLISSAAMPFRSCSSRAATSTYCSIVRPQILTNTGQSTLRKKGK